MVGVILDILLSGLGPPYLLLKWDLCPMAGPAAVSPPRQAAFRMLLCPRVDILLGSPNS